MYYYGKYRVTLLACLTVGQGGDGVQKSISFCKMLYLALLNKSRTRNGYIGYVLEVCVCVCVRVLHGATRTSLFLCIKYEYLT